jgi:hypothetical protein
MKRIAAVVVAIVVLCGCAWLWLGRGENLAAKTLDLERSLLAGGVHGRETKPAVDEIIRNIDRLDRKEVTVLQRSLEQDWKRLREEDVRAYFAALPAERQAVLDRGIDHTLTYRELRFAFNPRSWSPEAGVRRKPQPARKPARPAGGDTASLRQLQERYGDALRQRARERKIDLPEWQ